MNSDPEMDALVAALRDDLPSERDSARLRMRLSALGLATSAPFVGGAAAASTTSAAGTALQSAALGSAGEAALQVGGWTWALKVGAVAVASASAVAGPAWYLQSRPRAESAAAVASARVLETPARTSPARAGVEKNSAPLPVLDEPATAAATPSPEAAPPRSAARAVGVAAGAPLPAELGPPSAAPVAVESPSSERATAAFAADAPPVLAPSSLEGTTLREETLLIDGALSALRAGDSARAGALLAEHQRRFPSGLLHRERARAERKLTEILRAPGAR